MLKFNNANANKALLIEANVERYLTILNRVKEILDETTNSQQAEVIRNLLSLLERREFALFSQSINTVDMWGAAGAVWEVPIDDYSCMKMFENEMINLISLMEETTILGRWIKPIKKYFNKD